MSLKLQCIKTHFNAKTQYIVVQESNSFEFGWLQSLFCPNENRGINYPNVQEGSNKLNNKACYLTFFLENFCLNLRLRLKVKFIIVSTLANNSNPWDKYENESECEKKNAVKVETIIPCFQLILAAKKHMYFLLVI